MTKQEVLEAANVMIAYANGKKIGTRPRRSTEPVLGILYVPTWNWEQKDYCVIPDPTYRPWTADEVPLGAWMRSKRNPQDRALIQWVSSQCDREMWLDKNEHSTDGGKTWLPCGVVEEAK
jgi:hypothetical protein